MVFCALAFVVSGLVQQNIDNAYQIPSTSSSLSLVGFRLMRNPSCIVEALRVQTSLGSHSFFEIVHSRKYVILKSRVDLSDKIQEVFGIVCYLYYFIFCKRLSKKKSSNSMLPWILEGSGTLDCTFC
jgi:hypothetical protein